MKNCYLPWLCSLCIATASLSAVQAQTPEQQQQQIEVMTYNVHNGIGMDGKRDYQRIGERIRTSGAEFVALQELDSATRRSRGANVLNEIALQTRLYPTFAKAIDFDGGSYGIGILSATPPQWVKRIALPGREERRQLLIAAFDHFILANVHLSLHADDRKASLPIILREAEKADRPFLLLGDWNDSPQSDFLKAVSEHFDILNPTQHPTYPAQAPNTCIDYIAVYRKPNNTINKTPNPTTYEKEKAATKWPYVRHAQIIADTVASDHRPVRLSLQFPLPENKLLPAPPYLQNPSSEGISIMAQTRAHCRVWVEYGKDSLHLQRVQALKNGQALCHDIEHRIRLENLSAGTPYYYRVCAQEIIENQAYHKTFGQTIRTPFYHFTLPQADKEDFTALLFNDLHNNGETIHALQRLSDSIPHDFICFNGDCLSEPQDRAHALQLIHRLTTAFNGANCPLYFIRGNHEIRNAYSSGMPSLIDYPDGKTYGAFNWGTTRFVVLDCGEDKPDDHWVYYGLNDFTAFRKKQVDFLQKEMQGKAFRKAQRRILIHHIPIWGNTDDYQPCTTLWNEVLQKAKFDLDCSAHTHEFRWYDADTIGNPCPVYIGGGPQKEKATVGVLSRKGKQLQLRILNAEGKCLKNHCWE